MTEFAALFGSWGIDAQAMGKVGWATWETIYMVLISTFVAYLIGLPLSIVLVCTDKGHILENSMLNKTLGAIVNIARSIPFIIFLILVIPITKILVGSFIGTIASIVPLSLAAIPFVARQAELSLKEIDRGLIEAAQSMGANNWQIIRNVLIPEAKPSIILGIAITTITLIGYSAMAGIVGGGGLGTLAYYDGFQRYNQEILWTTVIVLVVLVQGIQMLGDRLVLKILNKRR